MVRGNFKCSLEKRPPFFLWLSLHSVGTEGTKRQTPPRGNAAHTVWRRTLRQQNVQRASGVIATQQQKVVNQSEWNGLFLLRNIKQGPTYVKCKASLNVQERSKQISQAWREHGHSEPPVTEGECQRKSCICGQQDHFLGTRDETLTLQP